MIVTRFEWVKMFYPDGPRGALTGIVVGIVHPFLPGKGVVAAPTSYWVFDHRTDDTQGSARFNSPMGLDVGTLRYLRALDPPVTDVHFWPEGSPVMLQAPLAAFEAPDAVTATSRTIAGKPRTRIFVPTHRWTPLPLYNELKPVYWKVTHLQEDGSVIERKDPR